MPILQVSLEQMQKCLIESFWVSNGQLKVRKKPEGTVSSSSHISGLGNFFPEHDFQIK